MDSKIDLREMVYNKDRRFGSNLNYFPARVIMPDGTEKNALFTEYGITDAVNRAERNEEDIPGKDFWEILFG